MQTIRLLRDGTVIGTITVNAKIVRLRTKDTALRAAWRRYEKDGLIVVSGGAREGLHYTTMKQQALGPNNFWHAIVPLRVALGLTTETSSD